MPASPRPALLALAAALLALGATGTRAQEPPALTFGAAGPGSAFLPYAQALKGPIEVAKAARVEVRQTGGSNENLDLVDGNPGAIGLAFVPSAVDAMAGTGWAQGRPHANLRALFPTYETSFQAVALTASRIRSVKDLDGRRVGVGPAKGPAELFFRVVAEVAGIKPEIVNGNSDDLARQVAEGKLDALWQGAVVPIPAIRLVQDAAEAVVFGLTDAEIDGTVKRVPALSPTIVRGQTYPGQTAPFKSVAGWNVVVAHKDLPEATAFALTKAILGLPNPDKTIGPAAAATKASSAPSVTAIPYHPGAAAYLAQAGVTIRGK